MKYIFITGMGRSGTVLISNLLKSVQYADVYHEYIGNREYWLLSWYLIGDVYAEPYLERVKKKIEMNFSNEYFIDVNSYLQNSVIETRNIFNPECVYHLVRDGRDVVRSIYSRRSDRNIHLVPKNRNDIEMWLAASKFKQICWNWASTTQNLISQGCKLIQLERIVMDYDYFKEQLLSPFGFIIEYSKWKNLVSKRLNRTRLRLNRFIYSTLKGKEFVKDELPTYENWTDNQKRIFFEICGEAMKKAGYIIS